MLFDRARNDMPFDRNRPEQYKNGAEICEIRTNKRCQQNEFGKHRDRNDSANTNKSPKRLQSSTGVPGSCQYKYITNQAKHPTRNTDPGFVRSEILHQDGHRHGPEQPQRGAQVQQ